MVQSNEKLIICQKCNSNELYFLRSKKIDFCPSCDSDEVGYYLIPYTESNKILETLIKAINLVDSSWVSFLVNGVTLDSSSPLNIRKVQHVPNPLH